MHYLSIDIDFWRDEHLAVSCIEKVVLGAKRSGIPIVAVTNHQQLLGHVNKSDAETLVNLDLHSDLDGDANELHCGTWVEYVSWRKHGTYVWLRTHSSCTHGRCDSYRSNDTLPWFHGSSWKSANGYRAPQDFVPGLEGCRGVGICTSPAFSMPNILESVSEALGHFGIPILAGDDTEEKVDFSGTPKEWDRLTVRQRLSLMQE